MGWKFSSMMGIFLPGPHTQNTLNRRNHNSCQEAPPVIAMDFDWNAAREVLGRDMRDHVRVIGCCLAWPRLMYEIFIDTFNAASFKATTPSLAWDSPSKYQVTQCHIGAQVRICKQGAEWAAPARAKRCKMRSFRAKQLAASSSKIAWDALQLALPVPWALYEAILLLFYRNTTSNRAGGSQPWEWQ